MSLRRFFYLFSLIKKKIIIKVNFGKEMLFNFLRDE
jgi:hypothetical protein